MKKSILLLFFMGTFLKISAQSAEIRPNQGISVPQFTTAFINALTTQPKGTVVFDKDLNVMKYWTGTIWQSMGGAGSSVGWTASGTNILNTNTGNVGIGTAAPIAKLDISTTTANASNLQSIATGASSRAIYGQVTNGGFGVLGEAFGPNAIGGYFVADGSTSTALKAETINNGNAAYFSAPGGGNAIITNEGNVGIGVVNPNKAKLELSSANTTTAVFGSSSTGISLQQNFPTVGFNQYRDVANTQRYIGTGYAMSNYLDPVTGTMNWNAISTGTAGTATPAETFAMKLSRSGALTPQSIEAPSTGLGIYGGNNITAIVSNVSDDGTLRVSSTSGGLLQLGSREVLIDGTSIQARGSNFGIGNFSKFENNLRINPYGGKVGINSGNINLSANLEVYRSPTSNGGTAVFKGTTHFSHFHFGNTEDTYIRGGKDGSAVIINDGGLGNVGIGVFPSTYKLEVNGTMRAKEVIVETGWADYVFDKNYQLRSIEDMEDFIKNNKHLPNIPSAVEIESKGLKVGETNKAMMEKIEELALYIIQLNKKIEVLESKK